MASQFFRLLTATTLIASLVGPAFGQSTMEQADEALNRMSEIDSVLVNTASTEQDRRTALLDLRRVHEQLGQLYANSENSSERGLLKTWQTAADEIYTKNYQGLGLTPLNQPPAPVAERPAPDARVLPFEPVPLPEYQGADATPHIELTNRISTLQDQLYEHSFTRPVEPPPPALPSPEMLAWNETYDQLLTQTILAQEQLVYDRGNGFTDQQRNDILDSFNDFDRIKTLLDDAAATDAIAQDLRGRMGDIERAFVRQQNLVAEGSNFDGTWNTEWLQTAYLKMAYVMIGEQLNAVDADYSASIVEILALKGPAERRLLDALDARMSAGFNAINRVMPDGQAFEIHPPRSGEIQRNVRDLFNAYYFEQMNHPLYSQDKSAETYKGKVDVLVQGFQNGQFSQKNVVRALRQTRDEMTAQKPYRNKRQDLIKEIDRTNKEIDQILYKKKDN